MATYTTASAFEAYTTGSIPTDPDQLEALLQRAEKDVDRIVIPVEERINEVQGITMANITGGQFQLEFLWNGVTYTSAVIPWNATGNEYIAALLAATDPYGNPLPPAGVVAGLDNSQYAQPWAYGPLPNTPIVFEWTNIFGNQEFALPEVINDQLQGSAPSVTVTEIVKGGLKINPFLLSGNDSNILSNATCAQAEYRYEMGEAFFRRAQWQSVSGPDFKTQGKLPLIGPKTKQELVGSDLYQRGARARPGTVKGRQIVYSPVGGTPIPDDWRPV